MESTEAVLLIDAENAFNRLNRQTALLNIRHICPKISTYLINTYRLPARLILGEGVEILSQEGTTQGENLAMAFYALSLKKLLVSLNKIGCHQEWFADDAGGLKKLVQLREWFDLLTSIGPKLGYFPKPSKCWLVIKSEGLREQAKQVFENTNINITSEGRPYLGAAIGSQNFTNDYLRDKVEKWSNELSSLEAAAKTEPHLAYIALVKVIQSRWNFIMRTVPGSELHMQPLEAKLRNVISLLFDRTLSDLERDIIALPCSAGGLGLINPTECASRFYENSVKLTNKLKNAIIAKQDLIDYTNRTGRAEISGSNRKHAKEALEIVYSRSENEMKRTLDLLQLKGTSAWLTCLPSREQNFYMNRNEFRDALCLRYGWHLKGMAQTCECGAANDIDHALICKLGGFVIMRHNAVRDVEADFLLNVCKDVSVEPGLIQLTGNEELASGSNLEDNARLDISCRGFWAPLQKIFLDVRFTHPNAPSNRNRKLKPLLKTHENRKKVEYNDRVLQAEHASFTPLIFATNGAMAEEAERYHAILAEKNE